jgi:O-antigen ligase
MTDDARVPSTSARARPGAFLVAAAMLATLPIVQVQGPLHTTPVDLLNGLFVTLYWGYILARRDRIPFPLLFPFWLILLGSFFGLFAADEEIRAITAVGQELYLYLWFVTVTDFLTRYCRLRDAVPVWVAVACTVALLTVADLHFGLLGGLLAGDTVRAAGSFANPNMFGNYLVISFFLALALAATGKPFMWPALPVLLLGIMSTASNGSMLSFTAGATVTGLMYCLHLTPRQRAAAAGVILLGGAAVVVVLGGWWESVQQHALTQMSESRGEIGGAAMKGFDERFPLWLDAIESIRQTPTGVGPANFNRKGGLVSGDFHAAHNEYLGMLAERGPVGLVGWLGILLGTGMLVRRLAGRAAEGRPLAVQPLYGLIGAIAAHAGVVELFHFRHVWMALAIVAAAASPLTSTDAEDAPRAFAEAA